MDTCHHGLTPFTSFHGTYKKFYFCVRCYHTLCRLTRINIEDHHVLYLTLQKLNLCQHVFTLNFSSVHVNISYFCNLHMWINNIFSYADIAGSFRVRLMVGVHSIFGDMVEESLFSGLSLHLNHLIPY